MTRRLPSTRRFALASLVALVAGCGGGSDDPTSGERPADARESTPIDSTDDPAITDVSTAAPVDTSVDPGVVASDAPLPVDDAFDICASLPPLDQIGAVIGTPMTTLTELERGPGWALCEAGGAGDGISNVQFSRSTGTTKADALAVLEELDATVTELADPALPGAYASSGNVSIHIGEVLYSAQAITLDTITSPDDPAAIERSATLLTSWLALMGVTP